MDVPAETATLILEPVLDLRAAAPLRDAFLERRGAPVVVDASKVEQMGGLCLQVLIAARNAWAHDHTPFSLSPRSPSFDAALGAFGATGIAE